MNYRSHVKVCEKALHISTRQSGSAPSCANGVNESRTVRQTCIEGGFEAFSRLLCFQPYALVFFPYNLNDDLPMGALQGGYPRIQWARRV